MSLKAEQPSYIDITERDCPMHVEDETIYSVIDNAGNVIDTVPGNNKI